MSNTIREVTLNTAFRRLSDTAFRAASLVKIYPLNAHEDLIPLPEQVFRVGRDSQSDLWIDEVSISRTHAEIEPTEAGFVVRDMSSTNGTYVNDCRIESALLKGGDQLRFGNHIYKVLGANDVEGQFLETVYTRMIRDGLTGAYNKRYLIDALERDVKRSQRHERPLSIAVFDIDHFKQVNDRHGHLAGDEVLREFSRRIIETLRQDDIFARYGGEEFVAVFNETNIQQAMIVAEQCRREIASNIFAVAGAKIPITVSIGLAAIDELGVATESPVEELLQLADRRLYEAKGSGRNKVCAK